MLSEKDVYNRGVSRTAYAKTHKSNFRERDLEMGEIGEHYVAEVLFNKKEYTCYDISETKIGKEDDIDMLIVNNETGTRSTVEVKTDTAGWKTKNIFFEITSNKNIGGMMRSKAKWLVYCLLGNDENEDVLYTINMKKFQEYIVNYYLKPNKLTINDCAKMNRLIYKGNYNPYLKTGSEWYRSIRKAGEGAVGAVIPVVILERDGIIKESNTTKVPHPENWIERFTPKRDFVIVGDDTLQIA